MNRTTCPDKGGQPVRTGPDGQQPPFRGCPSGVRLSGPKEENHVEVSHARGGPSAVSPRLLNLRQMADYLGCSYWTVRDWVLAGFVPVVELPPLRPREGERARTTLRRVLVDRADVDAFIEARKSGSTREHESPARSIEAVNARPKRPRVPGLCPLSEAAD